MELDLIDKQILLELLKDGRKSLSALSKTIMKSNQDNMSHAGIAKRIAKLEKLGVLNVQGNISIKNLKYSAALILMEMSNYEEVQNIIDAYSECPRVFMLAQVTGQYNLIVGVVGQDMDVLRRYINLCGPTNKKGILHSAILFTSEVIMPEFMPLNLFSGVSKENECGNVCKACSALLDGKCRGCGNF